ncbi:MAG: hypothetical protein JNM88_01500 [Chitinophagaceae bacterium]|nr:hypothetical protein [Chitinophagaceae bacterium]
MKRHFLPFLLATGIFFSGKSYAQTVPTLVYDFGKGVFVKGDYVEEGKVMPVPFGSFAIIKVINVNTFRYNVEIKGKSIDYVTQVPSELQTIFRLPSTQPEASAKTSEATTDAQSAANLVEQQRTAVNNQKRNNQMLVQRRTDIINYNKLTSKEKKSKAPRTEVLRQKYNEANSLFKHNNIDLENVEPTEIDGIIEDIAAKTAELSESEKIINELKEACTAYTDAVKKVATIKLRRGELIDISKQNWNDYKELSNRLPAPLSEDMMRADYKKFSDTYTNVIALSIKAGMVTGVDSKVIQEVINKLNNSYKNLNEDGFLNLVRDVIVLQTALGSASSFTVVSPPIQIQGDYVAFDIKATPSRASDLQNYLSDKSFNIELPVKKGLKADFSVGPFIAFGSGAHDEKYYLEDSPKPDTVFLRQRDNNNSVSPGIAAQMHIYRRTGRNNALAAMFGVGAGFQSTSDANFTLFGGASWVMGKSQKVMVSLGISYLQVERLKNKEFNIGTEYAVSKITLGNVTEKVFKPSGFLSISYNLTNRIEVK